MLHLDGFPAGGFQNHRDGEGWQNWHIEPDRRLTAEEVKQRKQRWQNIEAVRKVDEADRQDKAKQRAHDLWSTASEALTDHAYLQKKAVSSYGLRQHQDALVIPIQDIRGVLCSLQFIRLDGGKRFLVGGKKQGCFHLIGTVQDTLCVAEGYATAATIHQATGYPVAIAFDAGNLGDVAKALRKKYPSAHLILCADNDHHRPDNPGVTKATEAAKSVKAKLAVPDFGRYRSPETTDFNDLARLLGEMAVAIQIDTAVAPDQDRLEIVELEDVDAEPVQWLWPGRFALGKLSIIAGYPGLGKSQLTASVMAVVTTGGLWPVSEEPFGPPADTLLLSAEDDIADTIKPRLMASGADLRRCRIIGSVSGTNRPQAGSKRRWFNLMDDLAHLEHALKRYPATRLIVIDPLSAYMGDSRRIDTHKTSDVRSLLAPLVELASRYRVAILGIFHLNKREGSSAMDRINGSGAFVAAARSVWLVAKDKADPSEDGHPQETEARLFVEVKNNLARRQSGLKFEIRGHQFDTFNGPISTSYLVWQNERTEVTADEALSGWFASRPQRSKQGEAEGFLLKLLADGPKDSNEIQKAAERAGHSWKTILRAKGQLEIRAEKLKGQGSASGWSWSLKDRQGDLDMAGPESASDGLSETQECQDGQECQDTHIEHLASLPKPSEIHC